MDRVELLSPAGDFPTALAAFEAGADAVYCGLGDFSARAKAVNFTLDDLRNLVRVARARGKRVYVTFNTLVDENGVKIPVIVRYGHEMDGDWFWWGSGWCTAAEFAAFCRLEADVLRRLCGNDQILFAYTPDRTWKDLGCPDDGGRNFLTWYPGDGYVDIVGFDDYSIGKGKTDEQAKANFAETLRKLRIVSEYADARGKAAALTECGCAGTRDDVYDSIFRLMTADGVKAAFVDTWGGKFTMPEDNPRIVEGLKAFVRKSRVLTESYPIKSK